MQHGKSIEADSRGYLGDGNQFWDDSAWVDMDGQWTTGLREGHCEDISCVGNQHAAVFAAQNVALKHMYTVSPQKRPKC